MCSRSACHWLLVISKLFNFHLGPVLLAGLFFPLPVLALLPRLPGKDRYRHATAFRVLTTLQHEADTEATGRLFK